MVVSVWRGQPRPGSRCFESGGPASRGDTAVDDQVGPGDVAAVVRGEVQGGVSDFLGAAPAMEGDGADVGVPVEVREVGALGDRQTDAPVAPACPTIDPGRAS